MVQDGQPKWKWVVLQGYATYNNNRVQNFLHEKRRLDYLAAVDCGWLNILHTLPTNAIIITTIIIIINARVLPFGGIHTDWLWFSKRSDWIAKKTNHSIYTEL